MALLVPSSPLSSPHPTPSFSRDTSAQQEGKNYRSARELPFELTQHAQTYLEEGLFTQAFNFLISVTGNSASSINRDGPATIPPASHLALAATLAIHPVTTTRTNDRQKWNEASAALRLLKLTHSLVGPVNAHFNPAFTFRRFDSRISRHGHDRLDDVDEDDEENRNAFTGDDLNTTYARSHSLWNRAEDFWLLVGWAFNCSCLSGIYAARWNHYHLFLEFLIEVLETDWDAHTRKEDPPPEETLLWQYIELVAGGHARQRRILRAIFADGSTRSLGEFREVFANELKEPTQEDSSVKKLEKQDHVDIEQDKYGDYLGQDDDDMSDGDGIDNDAMRTASGRPAKRRRTRERPSGGLTPRSSASSLRSAYTTDGEGDASSTPAATLGDHYSIHLRLRLLRLLTWVSSHETLTSTSPTTFPDLEELLTLFVEFIRPLPLPIFARFVLTSPTHPFDPTTMSNLCEAVLQRALEHSAPSRHSLALLSQKKLEQEYLPFAASKNSIDANARVSILLESLVRTLAGVGSLKKDNLLLAAVAEGIERRIAKVADVGEKKGGKKAKKRQGGEAVAWDWLVESGERMSRLVASLKED